MEDRIRKSKILLQSFEIKSNIASEKISNGAELDNTLIYHEYQVGTPVIMMIFARCSNTSLQRSNGSWGGKPWSFSLSSE